MEKNNTGKIVVSMRFSREELEKIDKRVKKVGTSRSFYIKQSIKGSTQAIEELINKKHHQERRKIQQKNNYELRKIGINLNQLTHKINMINMDSNKFFLGQRDLDIINQLRTTVIEVITFMNNDNKNNK